MLYQESGKLKMDTKYIRAKATSHYSVSAQKLIDSVQNIIDSAISYGYDSDGGEYRSVVLKYLQEDMRAFLKVTGLDKLYETQDDMFSLKKEFK